MNNTKTKIIDALDKFERKYIKGDGIYWLIVSLAIVGMLLVASEPVKASSPVYKNEICTTDKCKARVERLNVCNGDIKCAVKLTQEASYDYLHSELTNLKEKSSQPIKTGLNDTVKFLTSLEGIRLNAYFDGYANNSNRWSIGYGTKSYKGEVITKQEAIKRKMAVVKPMYDSIPSCFNENQKTALTSYMYNTGGFQMNLKYHIRECRKSDVEYIMNSWGWNKEIIPRRIKELSKYNS